MALIDKPQLCELIPHAGSMCLLDEVLSWDEEQIQCLTNSHLDPNNPLRNQDGLSAIALVEYGAQAMAVHGGLVASRNGEHLDEGYLAALRDIRLKDRQVDNIASALIVEAKKIMAAQGNMIYEFSVRANDTMLVSGRATVVSNL